MEAFQSVTTCPPNGMIDARYLHLEAEFFELEKNQSDFLLRSFVIWCESFFSEQFVVDWNWKERNVKVCSLCTPLQCFLIINSLALNRRFNTSKASAFLLYSVQQTEQEK